MKLLLKRIGIALLVTLIVFLGFMAFIGVMALVGTIGHRLGGDVGVCIGVFLFISLIIGIMFVCIERP